MYKCNKCNKEFYYESKLNEHTNRKTLCNLPKKEYKCKLCNVIFTCPYNQELHNKTKKHLNNLNNNLEDNIIEESQIQYNINYNELETKYNKLYKDYNELESKYKDLEVEYNKLKIENKLILENQNNTTDNISEEYIYVIHERTFLKLNANIYKIGRTKNLNNRINGYTKGSKYLFTTSCKDAVNAEKCILNYLKENDNYIQVKDYGNEYFRCNLNELKTDILQLIHTLDL